MEAYPGCIDIAPSVWKTCQVPGCGTQFKLFKYLEQHLRRQHGFDNVWLKASWLHLETNRERCTPPAEAVTGEEAAAVTVAFGEDGTVVEEDYCCLLCNGGKILRKRSFLPHMVRYHHKTMDEVKDWAVAKDAQLFKNNAVSEFTIRHLRLTKGLKTFHESVQEVADVAHEGDVCDQVSGRSSFVQPSAKARPRPASSSSSSTAASSVRLQPPPSSTRMLQSVQHELAEPMSEPASSQETPLPTPLSVTSSPGGSPTSPSMLAVLKSIEAKISGIGDAPKRDAAIEVPLPMVQLTAEVVEWTAGSLSEESRRHTWPIQHTTNVDIFEFQRFLRSRALSDQSVEIYTQGVRYFFNVFDISAENNSPIGALVVVYTEGLLTTAFELPLLSTEYSWTRKIIDSMTLLLDFLGIECNRRRFDEAGRCLRLLSKEYFASKKRSGYKDKKVNMLKKKQLDAERLKQLPPVTVTKSAVKQAMVDLHTIHNHVAGGGEFPLKLRHAANVAMVGTIFLNGFAGRSKEWRVMKLSDVKATIESGKTYFTCSQHKTAKIYGDLGKHIADGTMETIKRYIELPGTDRDVFLESGKLATTTVSVSSMLSRFGDLYLPGFQYPTVNLLRKYYHTAIEHDRSKAMAFVARLDAHSEAIARQVYCASNPEQDAEKAKHLVDVILEGPVEWPTQAELDAGSMGDVLKRFERGTAAEDEVDADVCGSSEDEVDAAVSEAAVPAAKKRRYGYIADKGKFEKIDPNPNLISHPPPPQQTQAVLSFGDQESTPRGKKSQFTLEQKNWIARECRTFMGGDAFVDHGQAPPAIELKRILDDGIAHGRLPQDATQEKVRHVARNWKCTEPRGVDID